MLASIHPPHPCAEPSVLSSFLHKLSGSQNLNFDLGLNAFHRFVFPVIHENIYWQMFSGSSDSSQAKEEERLFYLLNLPWVLWTRQWGYELLDCTLQLCDFTLSSKVSPVSTHIERGTQGGSAP